MDYFDILLAKKLSGGGGGGENNLKAIAATGQQYIELPLYDDDNPIITFKMLITANSPQGIILGDLWDLSAFCLYMESDTNCYFRYNSIYENMYTIPQNRWNWSDVSIDYKTGKVIVDGKIYSTENPKTQLHNQIKLFGLANEHMASVAIKDFKTYKNNELYLDFEPRKDAETGAGYFYDKVNKQNYYSGSNVPLIYSDLS